MVLLVGRGPTVPQVATMHAYGEDVVRTWLHRYQQQGIAGLQDEPRGGRPVKERVAPHIIDTQASQSPQCSGHVQTDWTVGLLTAFVSWRFRLRRSLSTVRRLLHQAGWRWRRPRLAPASVRRRKRDPQTEAKLAAQAAAAAGTATLLFLDECDLHLLPVLRAMWMKGWRVRVPTPGQNAKQVFFGALDARTGEVHVVAEERKLAVHFVAFLPPLAAASPIGWLCLAMDNVRMHDAKVVRCWLAHNPRVAAVWLPKDAAHEVNPIERIWRLLKAAVAANRLSGSIQELTTTAHGFFADLAPHPVPLAAAA